MRQLVELLPEYAVQSGGVPDQRISPEFPGIPDVNVAASVAATFGFLLLCLLAVWWIFGTGYKLKA